MTGDAPSLNPYAPPTADLETRAITADPRSDELASRWRRLGGSLIDGVLQGLTLLPTYVITATPVLLEARAKSANPFVQYTMSGTAGIVAAGLLVALLALEAILLVKRGQTVGKILVGTRVVMTDGSRAPFFRVFVVRSLAMHLLAYVPTVGAYLATAELLPIFRKDRRCLHDHLAGTKVIRVPVKTAGSAT